MPYYFHQPKTLILTTNYPPIYPKVSFTQHLQISLVHPNIPKPKQGYKLTLIQVGATMAKTLNMLLSKNLGFHHLLKGLRFSNQLHSISKRPTFSIKSLFSSIKAFCISVNCPMDAKAPTQPSSSQIMQMLTSVSRFSMHN